MPLPLSAPVPMLHRRMRAEQHGLQRSHVRLAERDVLGLDVCDVARCLPVPHGESDSLPQRYVRAHHSGVQRCVPQADPRAVLGRVVRGERARLPVQ